MNSSLVFFLMDLILMTSCPIVYHNKNNNTETHNEQLDSQMASISSLDWALELRAGKVGGECAKFVVVDDSNEAGQFEKLLKQVRSHLSLHVSHRAIIFKLDSSGTQMGCREMILKQASTMEQWKRDGGESMTEDRMQIYIICSENLANERRDSDSLWKPTNNGSKFKDTNYGSAKLVTEKLSPADNTKQFAYLIAPSKEPSSPTTMDFLNFCPAICKRTVTSGSSLIPNRTPVDIERNAAPTNGKESRSRQEVAAAAAVAAAYREHGAEPCWADFSIAGMRTFPCGSLTPEERQLVTHERTCENSTLWLEFGFLSLALVCLATMVSGSARSQPEDDSLARFKRNTSLDFMIATLSFYFYIAWVLLFCYLEHWHNIFLGSKLDWLRTLVEQLLSNFGSAAVLVVPVVRLFDSLDHLPLAHIVYPQIILWTALKMLNLYAGSPLLPIVMGLVTQVSIELWRKTLKRPHMGQMFARIFIQLKSQWLQIISATWSWFESYEPMRRLILRLLVTICLKISIELLLKLAKLLVQMIAGSTSSSQSLSKNFYTSNHGDSTVL